MDFLIAVHNKLRTEREVDWHLCSDPLYNLPDNQGRYPVFSTRSSKIVELLLKQKDLVVKDKDGCPLLWHCVKGGILTETVAKDEKLRHQYGQKLFGMFPLEIGKA